MTDKEIMQALVDGYSIQVKDNSKPIFLNDKGFLESNGWELEFSALDCNGKCSIIPKMSLADLKPGQFAKISKNNKYHPNKTAFCFGGEGTIAKVTFLEQPSWISDADSSTCRQFECELLNKPKF